MGPRILKLGFARWIMNAVDRFIASCPSWEDFWHRTRRLSKAEMGRTFERLVQLYLQTEPEYRTILRRVWTLRDVPARVRKRLELPHPAGRAKRKHAANRRIRHHPPANVGSCSTG